MIKGTKLGESVWIRVPGERRAKYVFLGNIYMPPESKTRVKEIQKKFGDVAVIVQKYTWYKARRSSTGGIVESENWKSKQPE